MKIIVGLGNIGPQYYETRHNTGFMVVDELAERHQLPFSTRKMDAKIAQGMINGEKVLLVKPTTFMNESGRAVRPIMDYYKIDVADIVIVHDDMDLPLGKIRLRQKGSAAGHNGIKSIIAHVGTPAFNRVRVGIAHPERMSVINWVLGKFSQTERIEFDKGRDLAVDALEDWLKDEDFATLMNQYN